MALGIEVVANVGIVQVRHALLAHNQCRSVNSRALRVFLLSGHKPVRL